MQAGGTHSFFGEIDSLRIWISSEADQVSFSFTLELCTVSTGTTPACSFQLALGLLLHRSSSLLTVRLCCCRRASRLTGQTAASAGGAGSLDQRS